MSTSDHPIGPPPPQTYGTLPRIPEGPSYSEETLVRILEVLKQIRDRLPTKPYPEPIGWPYVNPYPQPQPYWRDVQVTSGQVQVTSEGQQTWNV